VRYCLILIFLSGIYTCNSQDILAKADSLMESGDFGQAGLYYEWAMYSESGTDVYFSAINGRIRSLKKQGHYFRAADFIDRLPKAALPDSVSLPIIYESLLLNYLDGNYEEVRSRYLLSGQYLSGSAYKTGADLLVCLSNLMTGNYDNVLTSAEEYIKQVAPSDHTDSLLVEFKTIFDINEIPKPRNPRTARILSMIIPGSGQAYAGYPGDGFISFGLHALALGGAGLAFVHGFYVTGWIGGLGLLQKLYFGGNQRAAHLAEEKNRLNREKFVQPAIAFLISLSEKYK